jgi:hypothetical protein
LFGLLAVSRGGLPAGIIVKALLETPELSTADPDELRETITVLLRQVRPYLSNAHGRHDFFYQSFREASAAGGRVAELHELLARVCATWRDLDGEDERYALVAGAWHCALAGDTDAAADRLADFTLLFRRLECVGIDEVSTIAGDYDLVLQGAGRASEDGEDSLDVWALFWRENAHHLRAGDATWGPERILLQRAWEHADDSAVTRGAEAFLAAGGCDWLWLRMRRRPTTAGGPRCLVALPVGAMVVRMAVDAEGESAVVLTGAYDAIGNFTSHDRFLLLSLDPRRPGIVQPLNPSRGTRWDESIGTTEEFLAYLRDSLGEEPHPRLQKLLRSPAVEDAPLLHQWDVYNPEADYDQIALWVADHSRVVTGTHDGVVRVWDATSYTSGQGTAPSDPVAQEALPPRARPRVVAGTTAPLELFEALTDYRGSRDHYIASMRMGLTQEKAQKQDAAKATSTHWELLNTRSSTSLFWFGSKFRLDLIDRETRRRVASWFTDTSLYPTDYDNCILQYSALRIAEGLVVNDRVVQVVDGTEVVPLDPVEIVPKKLPPKPAPPPEVDEFKGEITEPVPRLPPRPLPRKPSRRTIPSPWGPMELPSRQTPPSVPPPPPRPVSERPGAPEAAEESPARKVEVTITKEDSLEASVETFRRASVRIGRSPRQTDLVLSSNLVNRAHAEFVIKDGRVILVDRGSSNGTTLNGKRIVAPHIVRPEDEIGIGEFRLRVRLIDIGDAKIPSNPTTRSE